MEDDAPTPGLDALRDLLRGVKQSSTGGSRAVDRLRSRTAANKEPTTPVNPRYWKGQPSEDDVAATLEGKRLWPAPLMDHIYLEEEVVSQRKTKKKKKKKDPFSMATLGGPPLQLDPLGQVQSRALTPRAMKEDEEEQMRSEPPLSCSMAVIRQWTRSFEREETGFDSVSVFLETRLREALVQTSAAGMAVPNRARAAMCCDLLLKMPKLFGRYGPLVRNVIGEVLRCVYDNYDGLEARIWKEYGLSQQQIQQQDADPATLAVQTAADHIDAQTLFHETAYFDLAAALKKRAAMLQAELKETSEGAGLVKLFRERFLLWDGRNLLLRCILFHGWRKYTRTMVAGRHRLKMMRLQYWFDRMWEGIEREREDKESMLERMNAAIAAGDNSAEKTTKEEDNETEDDDNESRHKVVQSSALVRRSRRESRRSSGIVEAFQIQFQEHNDPVKASEIALKFLGVAQHRAALVQALDRVATTRNFPRNMLPAQEVLMTLIRVMEDFSGHELNANLAMNLDFATGVSLFPETCDDDDDDDDTSASSKTKHGVMDEVNYMEWLGFGSTGRPGSDQAYAWERVRAFIHELPTAALTEKQTTLLTLATGGATLVGGTDLVEKATQTDVVTPSKLRGGTIDDDDEEDDDDDAFGEDDLRPHQSPQQRGRKGKKKKKVPGESNEQAIKDKDATSNVAIASVCQLIPLLYDRLLEVCDGTDEAAQHVKLVEVAKYALVRRFGIKTIANNYWRTMTRTAQLCADRELRIQLFCLVFGVDPDTTSKAAVTTSKKKTTPVVTTKAKKGLPPPAAAAPETNQKQKRVEVVSVFCDLWHNYFTALQTFETTKIQATSKARRRVRASFRHPRSKKSGGDKSSLGQFLAGTEDNEANFKCADVPGAVATLQTLAEFRTAKESDLQSLVESCVVFDAPSGTTLMRQNETSQEPVLLLGLQGDAAVYVKTSTLVDDNDDGNSLENKGSLIKAMTAPFVAGEGRLLTGILPTASVVATSRSKILVCRLDAFEQLLDDGCNSALRGLEVNVVQRAEERVAATGASVSKERIAVYRQFFTDVDVTRSGKIILRELLEALQLRGTKLNTRDVEKAFKTADVDNKNELDFEQFIQMCDGLVRRGKRLFDKGTITDVLKAPSETPGGGAGKGQATKDPHQPQSNLLYEALHVAVERTFRHAAMHDPEAYKELVSALEATTKRKVADPSQFLASTAHHNGDDDPALAKKEAGEYVVVDADEAMLVVMKFWKIEAACKHKLIRVTRARMKVGIMVRQWLHRRRERKEERRLFTEFLQNKTSLRGVVDYHNFMDLMEHAYGAQISDELGATLFAEFDDLATRIAGASGEALAYAQQALRAHVAATKIQLFHLRCAPNRHETARLRAQLLITCVAGADLANRADLLRIQESDVADIVRGLHIDVGARIAHFLMALRPPKINEEAAFLAFQHHGLRMGKGKRNREARQSQLVVPGGGGSPKKKHVSISPGSNSRSPSSSTSSRQLR